MTDNDNVKGKKLSVMGFCLLSLLGFSVASLADEADSSVQSITRKDVAGLRVFSTDVDRLIITLKTTDGKSYRLKALTAKEADQLMLFLSTGKQIQISYPQSSKGNYILANNWQAE